MPAPTPAPAPAGHRVVSIDGLRAASALAIIVHHYHNYLWMGRPEAYGGEALQFVATYLRSSVQVFFLVSGFAIAHSLRGIVIDGGVVGRFILRRSIRLDPLYWIGLALALTYYFAIGDAITQLDLRGEIVTNALYVNGLMGTRFLVTPGWTLAIELQFYLALVLLGWLAQRIGSRAVVFGPLMIAGVLLGANASSTTPPWFVPHWNVFFIGVTISWAVSGTVGWWLPAIGVACQLALIPFAPHFVDVHTCLTVAVCAGAVVMAATSTKLDWLLANPPMRFIGRISYSLYITHWIVGREYLIASVRALGRPATEGEGIVLFATAVALSIGSAYVLYLLVESPTHHLSRRIKLATTAPSRR
jgi:peptidoglycan/LPS O-acetylase OafA/YrhL